MKNGGREGGRSSRSIVPALRWAWRHSGECLESRDWGAGREGPCRYRDPRCSGLWGLSVPGEEQGRCVSDLATREPLESQAGARRPALRLPQRSAPAPLAVRCARRSVQEPACPACHSGRGFLRSRASHCARSGFLITSE